MKKLGKKKYQVIETVEAYSKCSDLVICNCGNGSAYSSLNTKGYWAMFWSM